MMDDEKLKDIALNFQANINDKLLKENMELKKEIEALQTDQNAYKEGYDACKRIMAREKQAQELIEQAYLCGYKDSEEKKLEVYEKVKQKLIEQGRKEAWEAMRTIVGLGEPLEVCGAAGFRNFVCGVSASEAIEKLRKYEEQKKQEENEIKIGDEVTYTFDNGISIIPFVVLKIRCLEDGGKYYEGLEISDMRWVGGGMDYKKTGRTFPEIAEVLKKMQEGEE